MSGPMVLAFDDEAPLAAALAAALLALAGEGRRATASGRVWTLPVCFDDAFAPDLADVAVLEVAPPVLPDPLVEVEALGAGGEDRMRHRSESTFRGQLAGTTSR